MLKRWFWPLLLLLAGVFAAAEIVAMRGETPTWDEGIEIASGYSFIRTGEYRIATDHPPLFRLLAAIPLLAMNPSVPTDDPSWTAPTDKRFGRIFLYRNRIPADAMVFAARIPMLAMTVLLILLAALWTRRVFGAAPALLCACLLAFDPNVIANGHLVKNDVMLALFAFAAVMAWGEYLRAGRIRWLPAAGAAFGLAIATKFSAFFLVPVLALLWAMDRWHKKQPPEIGRGAVSLAVIAAIALPVLALTYWPQWPKLRPATRAYRAAHPEVRRVADAIGPETAPARWFEAACQRMGLQDHPALTGLVRFLNHTTTGHPAYLLGEISQSGWWYYFPVAFLVKTPVATLCVLLLALGLAVRRAVHAPPGWLRSLRLEWRLCAIPPAVFLAAAIANSVDTGERLLLPIYPFVFAAAAAAVCRTAWRWRPYVVPALAALLLCESASIFPHDLAFFNFAVGGPGAGPRYLLDSNLDWGQDLLYLRDYWVARGRPKLCLLYFGTADPAYYGIRYDEVPRTWDPQGQREADCLAAVSATPLYDLYLKLGEMAWLRARTPVAKIGYSIYVYDLRHYVHRNSRQP